jgi:hypothetical protein
MTKETLNILFLLSPLLIGGIIAIINIDEVNDSTEKAEEWTRKTQSKVSIKNGWFSRYISNPILWIIVKFSDWTDDFTHRGLKNGIRVAATLYLIGVWLYLLFFAFMVIVTLAIIAVVIYIVFKVLLNTNDDVKQSYEKGRRIVGAAGSGKRVNPNTGVIQKDGIFGWADTDQRIDPETGLVQTKGVIGWNDTETRINQETGNIQKEGVFGYNDTDTRINPETGVIQKNGILGWSDTDERINPETGRHQKNGMLGWSDD